MNTFPGAIRNAVLDTGPLMSALVANFLDRMPGITADCSSYGDWQFHPPLLSRDGQQQLLGLLAGLRDRKTIAHVMAEISALLDSKLKLRGPYPQLFWQWSIDLLTQWNLDERLIRLVAPPPSDRSLKLMVETGLTDFSVTN